MRNITRWHVSLVTLIAVAALGAGIVCWIAMGAEAAPAGASDAASGSPWSASATGSCGGGVAVSAQANESMGDPQSDACDNCNSDSQCRNHCCPSGVGICRANGQCLCMLAEQEAPAI